MSIVKLNNTETIDGVSSCHINQIKVEIQVISGLSSRLRSVNTDLGSRNEN